MGRSISQIYSEAVAKRNNYLQLTELNSGRSTSKMSVINVITYVMASLIYTYETILDVFEINISKLIANRINGTAKYYAVMAKNFQYYNTREESAVRLIFNENTCQIEYEKIDTSRRIITHSAYQYYAGQSGVTIKVCKDNSGQADGGGVYAPLTEDELTSFKNYIDEIKFVGAQIQILSTYGDLMNVNANIVYDDLYITEEQAFEAVKTSLINYAKNLDYNGYIYYQSVVDAIQSVDHIVDVTGKDGSGYVEVTLTPCHDNGTVYIEEAETVLYGGKIAKSGYVTFINELGNSPVSNLIKGEGHLNFVKLSERNGNA